jgi:AcrR family transcriptional regulator
MEDQADRRSQILDAALTAFLDRGYAATSIADIRAASGASTGSIYHFFDGKPGLALALLQRAVAGWTAAGPAASDVSLSAEATIRASVAGLVTWGEANPALLRFMDEMRSLSVAHTEHLAIRALLATGQREAEARYARFAASGAVRPLPWPIARALMLGPAYDYLRTGIPVPAAADTLASAAWAAVRQP